MNFFHRKECIRSIWKLKLELKVIKYTNLSFPVLSVDNSNVRLSILALLATGPVESQRRPAHTRPHSHGHPQLSQMCDMPSHGCPDGFGQ